MFFCSVWFFTLQLKLYCLWLFYLWYVFLFGNKFNLSKDNILNVNNLLRFRFPNLIVFYTIFITNKDTFFYLYYPSYSYLPLEHVHKHHNQTLWDVQETFSYQSMPHVAFCSPTLMRVIYLPYNIYYPLPLPKIHVLTQYHWACSLIFPSTSYSSFLQPHSIEVCME